MGDLVPVVFYIQEVDIFMGSFSDSIARLKFAACISQQGGKLGD